MLKVWMLLGCYPEFFYNIIAWDKATILGYELNYYARKMKEPIYIDLFAKTGIMN